MNLRTLDWDPELLDAIGVPAAMLPRDPVLVPRSTAPPAARSPACRWPRRWATSRRRCSARPAFQPGEGKCTYGTGSFLLLNTGTSPVVSRHGLLTTVGYRIGEQPATYALEGAIAVTGSLVQWLRDNLGLISSAPEVETLARTVDDNGGCYFVPAFSGLFAPHWRCDARGVIAGLTGYVTKGHIARAVLEATAWQTREVVDAMDADSGVPLTAAEGRRRDDRQRAADAVPGRRAGRAGGAAGGRRDDLPRRGVRGGAGGGFLAGPCDAAGAVARGRPVELRRWPPTSGSGSCATGARRSGQPWTGRTIPPPNPARSE